MRNARREAFERVGGHFEVRVLEPSPPAAHEPPWFADDPVGTGGPAGGGGRPLVMPIATAGGHRTWDDLVTEAADGDGGLAAWCADRWLGAWRRLPPLPDGFATTRASLHAVAEHALQPARHRANGKIGLRWTLGGFGTPFFGNDLQARVEGTDVVLDGPEHQERARLTTVAAAARVAGVSPGAPPGLYGEPSTPFDPDAPLDVDPAAASFLGDWFGFVTSVLEQLRAEAGPAEAGPADAPSRVQLWPEHFDLAFDSGDQAAGQRANYGGSPGDSGHPDPYLYVGPWADVGRDPAWNAPHFRGAVLGVDDLAAAGDQRAAALDFFRAGRERLRHTEGGRR